MARIESFKGYGGEPRAAKPDVPPPANVVTAITKKRSVPVALDKETIASYTFP